jgi:glucose-6-phosphate 1-dehydrogenase
MERADTNNLPTSVVIFGASGDLTKRKLVPALYSLYAKDRLQEKINIVGFSRRPFSHDEFRQLLLSGMQELAGAIPVGEDWKQFSQNLWYVRGDLNQVSDFENLRTFLHQLEGEPSNRLYYLATAPFLFPVIIDQLGKSEMIQEENGWRRMVIEKPFGSDLTSAMELNKAVHVVCDESQVYRIDHYLGKETAQNILYFRFLNTIFEPIWNRNFIDHVQITVAENVDVGHRAGYYDQAGVMRDVFQNHLLQLLTLVAMEPPATFDADSVRNEKVKVLRAVRPIALGDTVRAQYEGYCQTEGVAPHSQTPTYAAVKLFIDNWRWQGVPFYLRSGKALATKTSELVIEFKAPPHVMFDLPDDYILTPNQLSLCIQPDEGIHLRFETKVPGSPQETRSVDMEFHYRSSFKGESLPDAYQRLLLDALNGDASLFTRSDEIELAWSIVDPVLEGWESSPQASPLVSYIPGSWGPLEADRFLAGDSRIWRLGCGAHEKRGQGG